MTADTFFFLTSALTFLLILGIDKLLTLLLGRFLHRGWLTFLRSILWGCLCAFFIFAGLFFRVSDIQLFIPVALIAVFFLYKFISHKTSEHSKQTEPVVPSKQAAVISHYANTIKQQIAERSNANPNANSTAVTVHVPPSMDLSWLLIGIPLLALLLIWIFYGLLDTSENLLLLLLLIGVLTILGTAVTVYVECNKAITTTLTANQTSRLSTNYWRAKIIPFIWLALCICIWFIAYPAYMYKRTSYAPFGLLLPAKLGFLLSSKLWLLLLSKIGMLMASIILGVTLIGSFLHISDEIIKANPDSFKGSGSSGRSYHRWYHDD